MLSKMNRRTKTLILVTTMAAILIVIAIAGVVMPSVLYEPNFEAKRLAPCLAHPFGTDYMGRDMFWRTIKGLSTSILIGLLASTVSAILALILGIMSATIGGWFDYIISWLTDLCMGLPHLVLLILISFMLGRGMKGVIIGVALTHWTALTRIIRAEVLQIRTSHYVQAARKFGESSWFIARAHILPHVIPQFVIGLILLFPHAILHEASITFLGFGLPIGMPAVGIILSESMQYLALGMWWLAVLPGIALLIVVMMFDHIGENLRKLIDPASSQE